MTDITSVTWTDGGKHTVKVVTADGAVSFVPWAENNPPGSSLSAAIIAWIDAGNSIAEAPGPSLDALKAEKQRAIDRKRDEILKAGKLYAGLHVALLDKKGTDGPRADLSGMATNAIGVLIELPGLTWPDSYQDGWIAVENERIPMPMPADGLALAQACAAYFAAVVQTARDKKDACLAAEDEAALDAVSIDDGWPANDDPVE